MGKWLLLLGIAVAVIGALLMGLGRLGFRGLPGDISYKSEHVQFYFPIVTCIVLSVLLTVGMWLWHWLAGK
ncbi:MAG TPA: DUF2905 domain-containing protein [Tepidisphaeraceae bacterium]|nr:DUF2905 domain-containing protein [Tepidisphaeraceae bacterium]